MTEEQRLEAQEKADIIGGLCGITYSFTKFIFLIYAILALNKYIGG